MRMPIAEILQSLAKALGDFLICRRDIENKRRSRPLVFRIWFRCFGYDDPLTLDAAEHLTATFSRPWEHLDVF